MESKENKENMEFPRKGLLKEPVLTDIISRNTELSLSNVLKQRRIKEKEKIRNRK